MRMLALGLFASTALCTSSFAADLAPVEAVPETTWTGFYAGLEVGYAFADQAEYDYGIDVVNDVLEDYGLLSNDLDGLLGGAYAGFNHQMGDFVLGLEGSFAGAAIDGSSDAEESIDLGFATVGLTAETETEINWLATATGRVGYLVSDNFLIFAKGGAAFAEIDSGGTLDGFIQFPVGPRITANLASISASETALGFTVGAGGEYKFAEKWSAKIEYNYVRFDDVEFDGDYDVLGIFDGEYEYSADVDLHLVKVGVAYHF